MASLKERLESAASEHQHVEIGLLQSDGRYAIIPLSQLQPDPNQPRTVIGDVEDLQSSIRLHGIIQPLIVSIIAEDQYLLIAGERRYTAARALGLRHVPVIVRSLEDQRRLEIQIIENIQRKNLDPIDEASALQRLMSEFRLTQREIAERIGRSVSTINETLRILTLPADIRQFVRTSEHISRSILLEVAKKESEEEQRALWQLAQQGGASVRAIRTKRKDRRTAPRKKKVVLRLESALVTITFESENVTVDDVVCALQKAAELAVSPGIEESGSYQNEILAKDLVD